MSAVACRLYTGAEADRLLADPRFVARWDALHARCPEATVFQSSAFAAPWYRTYRRTFVPVIAAANRPDGELAGLWLLAHDPARRELVHAGAQQAEYHVWLAAAADAPGFLEAAWRDVCAALSFDALRFRYLPDAGLAAILEAVPAIARRISVRQVRRPVMRLDPARLRASFAKSGNRSRLNRLRHLGAVEFRRCSASARVEELLDEFIPMYDFRQGAANQATPFHDDALKRDFHVALFAAAPHAVRFSSTSVGERVAAASWLAVSGRTAHLGMLAHAPRFARHSPGKLHLLQLAAKLLEEGFEVLDLTPGGDAWKERFANAFDTVAEVTLHRSALARVGAELIERQSGRLRRVAARVGVRPVAVRRTLAALRRATVQRVIGKVRQWSAAQREFRIYRIARDEARGWPRDARIAENCLADLVLFEPGDPWQTREAFLASALARIEKGESVFTLRIDGRLAISCWVTWNQSESRMTEVGQTFAMPPGTSSIYDAYTHPDFRGRGLYRVVLGHILDVVFAVPSTRYVYGSVLADNAPSRRIIEAMGYKYLGSLHWKRRLGAERRWADPAFGSKPRTAPGWKMLALRACRRLGLFEAARRRSRHALRILCYHGFELEDESSFRPLLFMKGSTFARRLEQVKAMGFGVLPLAEALQRLDAGTLPPDTVAITADDGFHGFHSVALPLLREKGFPATVYTTTYYVEHRAPIFRLVVQYMFWKTQHKRLELKNVAWSSDRVVDLTDPRQAEEAAWDCIRYGESLHGEARRRPVSEALGAMLGVPLEHIERARMLQLMAPAELVSLKSAGIDVELHTHRHRFPVEDKVSALREISDNRAALDRCLGGEPRNHFCYPAGLWDMGQWPWLQEAGVASAVTCLPGLNGTDTPRLALRRFVDGESIHPLQFEAYLSGFFRRR